MRQRIPAFFSLLFLVMAAFYELPFALAGETPWDQNKPQAASYSFCMAMEDPTPAAPKGKAYFSDVFTTTDVRVLTPVRDAYIKFLQEKYAYAQDPTTFDNSVSCAKVHSMDEAASALQARLKPGKQANPEGTIETGWTYQAN
ncbi:MAG TPA: hypothetical protein VL688_02925 [Verrucomicrobiae bacterium]|nr:hypothetical protein [Verrucomicrobiae bacterium]